MTTTGVINAISINYRTRKPEISVEVDAKPEDLEKMQNKKLAIELKAYRKKRSLDANAYYWVLCTKIADAIGQSMSWVHNDMLRKYGQIELIDGQAVYLILPDSESAEKCAYEAQTYHIKPTSQVKLGRDGEMYRTYMMLKGSHEYDTKEMSVLINGIVQEASDLGIETMTPDQIKEMMTLYEEHSAKRQ